MSLDSVRPDCPCGDSACGRVAWAEGKRFVFECGQLASPEAFIAQQFAKLNARLERIERAITVNLAP